VVDNTIRVCDGQGIQNNMGRRFDIPWIGGSIHHGQGVHNTISGGSIYYGYGSENTMGRGFDLPWVGGSMHHG
jgi:hypothetical protein